MSMPSLSEGPSRRQSGLTLIELVMFIVIVSIGIAGILVVMNVVTRNSSDPMIRKQATAIAESLLEEIELQAFTFCDPDDANAATAAAAVVGGAAGCAANAQGLGPSPAGESRYVIPQFDNVGDYYGFTMSGIRDITNSAVTGLEGYAATVTMAQVGNDFAGAGGFNAPANDAVLQISVTVTAPDGSAITLSGYRFRYAPTTTP